MSRRVLLACYEVPGYGGASTASYRFLEVLRESGLDVSFVNVVDEQDPEFFRYLFGPSWGNPRSLGGVTNCVLAGSLYGPHPELSRLIDELAPDVMIGVGFIAALLLKRAAPERKLVYLTSGCQQLKNAIAGGIAHDFLAVEREIDRGIRRPGLTCLEEGEAMDLADLVVVHSEMTRRLYGYYFPNHVPKVFDRVLWFADWIYCDAREHSALSRPFAERDIDVLFVASSWNRTEKNFPLVQRIARALEGRRIHVVGEVEGNSIPAVLHGFVAEREALFDLMGRARTVVCPSRFDAAPGILFEASALGCNVVASPNCGNSMICNDRLHVREFTPHDFIRATEASLEREYDDNVALFLDGEAYREFLETIDVL